MQQPSGSQQPRAERRSRIDEQEDLRLEPSSLGYLRQLLEITQHDKLDDVGFTLIVKRVKMSKINANSQAAHHGLWPKEEPNSLADLGLKEEPNSQANLFEFEDVAEDYSDEEHFSDDVLCLLPE